MKPGNVPIAIAIAASGCGDSSRVNQANQWTITRETRPSGVEQVTNALPPEIIPTWTLVEEISVGVVEGAVVTDGLDVPYVVRMRITPVK